MILWLRYWLFWLLGWEAVRLHLRVTTVVRMKWHNGIYSFSKFVGAIHMAKIGDTFTASIKPTNAAGKSAPVFSADYNPDVAGFDGYDVTIAPDGLSAVLVAKAAGTGFQLTATAISKSGKLLTETVALPDVEAAVDDEAVALGLSVA